MIRYMRRKGFSWEDIVKITGFNCQQNVSPVQTAFQINSLAMIYFILEFLKALNIEYFVIEPLFTGSDIHLTGMVEASHSLRPIGFHVLNVRSPQYYDSDPKLRLCGL